MYALPIALFFCLPFHYAMSRGFLRLIFAGSLLFTASVVASNAAWAGNALQRVQLQSIATTCEITLGREIQLNWRNEQTITYKADNEKMHLCMFIFDLVAINCAAMNTCPTYHDWSVRNTGFSPKMPREAFWRKYDDRRNSLKLFDTTKKPEGTATKGNP
jgi:hypothetical protein